MGNEFVNIDLVRLSQKALPVAKPFDADHNGNLDKSEYKKFIDIWNKDHKENPLLMQLHIKTLSAEAQKLAQICDEDNYKGVLTENELKKFMELCEKNGIKSPFKQGVSLKTVLTGEETPKIVSHKQYKDNEDSFINNYMARCALFTNWLKLDVIGYKGSDKFFHAVGNYEAMMAGAEKTVKQVCAGQDKDKRENSKRPEADYTEDLYANWLGREFAKMYPNECPQELFSALAPNGFDIEESKKSPTKLMYENTKEKDGWIKGKINKYIDFFKEKYVRERFWEEIKESF